MPQVTQFLSKAAPFQTEIADLGICLCHSLLAKLAMSTMDASIELGTNQGTAAMEWPVKLSGAVKAIGTSGKVKLEDHPKMSRSLQHFFAWLYNGEGNFQYVSVYAYRKCSVNGMDLVAHPDEDVEDEDAPDLRSRFPMDVVQVFYQQQVRGQPLRMEPWFVRQLLFLEVMVRVKQQDGRFGPPVVHHLSYHNCLNRESLVRQDRDATSHLPVVTRTFYDGDHIASVRRIISQELAIPLTRWTGLPLRARERAEFLKKQNVVLIPFPYTIRHTRQ